MCGHWLGDADAGEHQVATTLAELIIGGSLAAHVTRHQPGPDGDVP
jgi:hypothetical protein